MLATETQRTQRKIIKNTLFSLSVSCRIYNISMAKERLYMKLTKFSLVLASLMILIMSCDEGSDNQIGKDPIINAINTNYIPTEKSLFLSVETDDPQGYEDVKTVVYWMYYTPVGDSVEAELELSALLDNGENGDIINDDGAFSRKFYDMEKGIYRIIAEAFDMDDNSSDIVHDTILALDNFPPEIYLFSAPESFEKGDTITFEIKVTDPEGIDDIFYVKVQIGQPDGEMNNQNYYLRDDALFGDNVANDGIYTISFPTNLSSKQHGFWEFYFDAIDKGGNSSNSLIAKVKNPGLAVLSPDGGESFNSGDIVDLTWDCIFIDTVVVSYTTNADEENPDFTIISEQPSYIKTFQWTIPTDLKSDKCKIYIYDKENNFRYDFSDDYFEVK